MRFIKPIYTDEEQNMRLLDAGDHFFLEVTKDIPTGMEYALMGRVLITENIGDNKTLAPETISNNNTADIGGGDIGGDEVSAPPAKRRKYKPRAKLDTSSLQISGKRSHRCTLCGKVFVSSQAFMRHRHECDCGRGKLKENIEGVEPDDGEKEDADAVDEEASEEEESDSPPPRRAPRRGRRKRRLRRSMRNDYDFECDECDRRFLKKQGLVEHMKRHIADKEFGCGSADCDSKFCTLGELNLHVKSKHKEHVYMCVPCEINFFTLEELKDHNSTHEKPKKFLDDCIPPVIDETLKYICEYCERPFPTISWLEAHRDKHTSTNIAIFVCKYCMEAFRYITHYEEHIKTHQDIRRLDQLQAEKFRCDNCLKEFRSMQQLEKHERMFGEGLQKKPTYKCDHCGKRLTQAGLENHIQKYHPKENAFKCLEKECSMTFKTKEERGEHLKEVHSINPNRAFVCPIENCNKAFASETTMNYHYQRVHTNQRPFTCEMCGKGWVKLGKLKEHLLTHTTEKNELCDVCGRAFKTRPELRDHKIEMHTSAGKIKLQCRYCPATFSRRSSRSYHERRHKGEAPYICPKPGCNKRFIAVIDYKRHLIYHTGAKLYRCKFCGNSFTRSDYLRGHEKKHHSKGEEYDVGPPIEETVNIKVPWPMDKAVRIQGQNVKVIIEPDPSLNNPQASLCAEAVAALGAMADANPSHVLEGTTHIPISSEVAAGIIQQVGTDAAGNVVQVVTSVGQPLATVMQHLPPEAVQSVVGSVMQPNVNTGEVVTHYVEQQQEDGTTQYIQVQGTQVQVLQPQQAEQQYVEQQNGEQQFVVQPTEGQQFVEQPTAEQQFVEQPTAEQQFVEQPTAEQQFVEQPNDEQQFVEQQNPEQQFVEQPTAGQQFVEQQSAEQQFVEQANAGQQFVEQQNPEQQFVEQPTAEQQFVEQPTAEQQFVEQPTAEQQFVEQPTAEQQFVEQPNAEQQFVEQANAGQQFVEQHYVQQTQTNQQQQYVEHAVMQAQNETHQFTDEEQQQAEANAAEQLLAQAEAAAVAATREDHHETGNTPQNEATQEHEPLQTVDLEEIAQNYMQV
uniref:Zinc finger protein 227-like n=1 Tax=Saccoglossus kowalevskii TaxID=10224 RepID=A0ABM0MME7_SACKO|nr:PREDICTED: zinc finger protein 227-like [Saccoglossus kowalevskii]